jgi:hypothetical protein
MNPIYEAGTISVAAGGTTVTGQSTLFLTQGIRPGDQFRAQGLSATIVSVNSNTSLTIKPWPGQAINTGNYEIQRVSDANRLLDATYLLMANLSNNLLALGQLTGASNKLPYFTGPNALALADLSAQARQLLDDTSFSAMHSTLGLVPQSSLDDATSGRLLQVGGHGIGGGARARTNANDAALGSNSAIPVAESDAAAANLPSLGGTGTTQRYWLVQTYGLSNRTTQIATEVFGIGTRRGRTFIRVRHDATWYGWVETVDRNQILGAVSQSGSVPTGALMEEGSNANGQYWRWANGVQLCMRFEEPFDVTSLGNQIRPMAASFTLARQFTFVSHCSTTPNNALLYNNIRYAYQDQTNFALRLTAAGTSSDPTSLNEKLTIASIGRWR